MPLFFQAVEPPPAAVEQPMTTHPEWRRRPSGEQVRRVFPKAARQQDLAGKATLRCRVTAQGSLADCSTTNVAPAGVGFDEAAMKLAPFFLMRPQTRAGVPVDGGTVIIPIRFLPPTERVMGPVSIRHASVKSGRAQVDCRYQNKTLDNCVFSSGPFEAADDLVRELQFRAFPGAPSGVGRITVIFEFKP